MFSGTIPTRVRLGGAKFGGAVSGNFGNVLQLGAPGPQLGQTPQEWYNRGKAAALAYQQLRDDVLPRIADLSSRAEITDWLGTVYQDDSPEHYWDAVSYNVNVTAAPENLGVGAYLDEKRQKRVTRLEETVKEFRQKVGDAGALVPEREAPRDDRGTTTIIKEGVDIGTPIGIGLGALAVAVIVSAFI